MSIVFWFIIVPLALALLPYILAAVGFGVKIYVDVQEEKEQDALREARRREIEARTAEREALADARLAAAWNRAVLGDIQVEILKLKQEQLEQRLGKNAQPFNPADYD